MSSPTAYATTLIGLKIAADDLHEFGEQHHNVCIYSKWDDKWHYSERKQSSCKECEDRFCPECGKLAYPRVRKMKDGFFTDDDFTTLNKLFYVGSMEEDGYIAVGVLIGEINYDVYDSENMSVNTIPNLNEVIDIKAKCKEVFEPYGLWDEKKFGIITVVQL